MAQNMVILKIKLNPEEKLLLQLERPIRFEDTGASRSKTCSLLIDVRRSLRRSKNNHGRAHPRTETLSQIIRSDDLYSKKSVVTNDHKSIKSEIIGSFITMET